MRLFQILLPRADNSGEPFPESEFDRLNELLARQFDGVTAYLQAPAEGLWRQDGKSSGDEIVIFEVMTEEGDLTDWRTLRSDLEQRFRQERVVIRYMPIQLV
jgi:hypothetical protein